jgi:serine/threonine protein kinase
MELLDGETLDQRLRHRGYFTPQEANTIMQAVCAALSVAHEHDIIHRDLKPENVFFHKDESREVIKLVDFGIAKHRGKVEDEEDIQLTQAGFVVGTPFYMSPEQCGGFEVDVRSDVYALGVILYQILTGKLPFDGNKASIVVMKHITDKAKPLYEIRPEIPAVINAVVMHALAKKPEDRPQTAMELARELDSAVKAVTEHELQKVFLDATEDDLEAALLLTSEPGSDAGLLAGSSLRRHTMSGLAAEAEKIKERQAQETVAISDSQQLPVGANQAIDGLFLELLYTAKDLIAVLEMIRNSLEQNSIPDREAFLELKHSIDQLRGVVFGLQTTHYKGEFYQ